MNKEKISIDNEINGLPKKRVKSFHSSLRIALAHMAVVLSFVGLLVSVFVTAYCGVMMAVGNANENLCNDFKAYNKDYPDSVDQRNIDFCSTIGIEIK